MGEIVRDSFDRFQSAPLPPAERSSHSGTVQVRVVQRLLPSPVQQRVIRRPEHLESAVSDENAALIAYFDDLKAGMSLYDQTLQSVIESRDYHTAEMVSSERETLRRVIAVDPNPGVKALIRDCLADGMVDRLRDAEISEYICPRHFHVRKCDMFGRYRQQLAMWQESRIRIVNRIETVREQSEVRIRQLLDEEQAAAFRNQFQRARELKSASESARLEADNSIRMLQVCNSLGQLQPHTQCTIVEHSSCANEVSLKQQSRL